MTDMEPIVVAVDEDIMDLIPMYLENRRNELPVAQRALASGDFETLKVIGHQLKGSGGGYGMDRLTELGMCLEEAANALDGEKAGESLEGVKEYLERVRVVPE